MANKVKRFFFLILIAVGAVLLLALPLLANFSWIWTGIYWTPWLNLIVMITPPGCYFCHYSYPLWRDGKPVVMTKPMLMKFLRIYLNFLPVTTFMVIIMIIMGPSQ